MKGNLSKKQIKIMMATEERKAKRRLSRQLQEDVSCEMVQDSLMKSSLDRLQTLLPIKPKGPPVVPHAKSRIAIQNWIDQLPFTPLKKSVEWLSVQQQEAKNMVSLSEELKRFADYVSLTPSEILCRTKLLEDIEEIVRLQWPHCDLQVFGSYSAGLSIYSSDLDLSIVLKPLPPNQSEDSTIPLTEVPIEPKKEPEEEEEVVWSIDNKPSVPNTTKTSNSNPQNSHPSESNSNLNLKTEETNGANTNTTCNKKKIHFPMKKHNQQEIINETNEQPTKESNTNQQNQANEPALIKPHEEECCLAEFSDFISQTNRVYPSELFDNLSSSSCSSSVSQIKSMTFIDLTEENNDLKLELDRCNEVEEITGHKRKRSDDSELEEDEEAEEELNENEESNNEEYFDDEDESNEELIEETDEDCDYFKEDSQEDDGEEDGEEEDNDEEDEEDSSEAKLFQPKTRLHSLDIDSDDCSSLSEIPKQPKQLIEEDLDIQFIDHDQNLVQHSSSTTELDFSNTFKQGKRDYLTTETLLSNEINEDNDDSEAQFNKQRRKILDYLRNLFKICKTIDWIHSIEFRSRAKIPIINFVHSNGISCDITFGLSKYETSIVLKAMKQQCGELIRIISSFLKVLLQQFDLDRPFTGGLGSFKLYVLIVLHYRQLLQKNSSHFSEKNLNYGFFLLSFLQFYSNKHHLSLESELTINYHDELLINEEQSVSITFERTTLLPEIQRLFHFSYQLLLHKSQEQFQQFKQKKTNQSSSTNEPPIPSTNHQFSSSILGVLLNCNQLIQERNQFLSKCNKFSQNLANPTLKLQRCKEILSLLLQGDSQSKANVMIQTLFSRDTTMILQDIRTIHPLFYLQLQSYYATPINHRSFLTNYASNSSNSSRFQPSNNNYNYFNGNKEIVIPHFVETRHGVVGKALLTSQSNKQTKASTATSTSSSVNSKTSRKRQKINENNKYHKQTKKHLSFPSRKNSNNNRNKR